MHNHPQHGRKACILWLLIGCSSHGRVGSDALASKPDGAVSSLADASSLAADATRPAMPTMHLADAATCAADHACPSEQPLKCGIGVVLDDAEPCTRDSCDESTGVIHMRVPDGTSCTAGESNACAAPKFCRAGRCESGAAPVIDDGNPCTSDGCDPARGIRHERMPDGTLCGDPNLCTQAAKCQQGTCEQGGQLLVDDDDPCTLDHCDAATGIVTHRPLENGLACDDQDVCNGREICQDGWCKPGVELPLDDGDPCTRDACDMHAGVYHIAAPDNMPCGNAGSCVQGLCVQVTPDPARQRLAAGYYHTCVVRADGLAKCWGSNDWGELGTGDQSSRGDKPGQMGSMLPSLPLRGRIVQAFGAGNTSTCAVLNTGEVDCWGWNALGQLGLGDTRPRYDPGDALQVVPLGTGRSASDVGMGHLHACALLDDKTVKCWGGNGEGQLGLGDSRHRGDTLGELGDALPAVALGTGRTVEALAVGFDHACAILDDHAVKCWGKNQFGNLGLSDFGAQGAMGDALPNVALGAGRTAKAVTAGYCHNCVILDDDSVKCWGCNYLGQLGLGDTNDRGDEPAELGNALMPVALGAGRTARAIAARDRHTCALLDNHTVKCWGFNGEGQLGLGDSRDRGANPGEMGDALPAVSLGSGRSARSVTVGSLHSCALLDDGSIKCWGANSVGLLGLGDTQNRGNAAGQMGDALPAVDL